MVIFHSYVSLPKGTLEYAWNAGCSWVSPHHSREMDMTWIKSQWNRREIRTIFKLQGQQTNQFIKNSIYWKTITKQNKSALRFINDHQVFSLTIFWGWLQIKLYQNLKDLFTSIPATPWAARTHGPFQRGPKSSVLTADPLIIISIYIYIHTLWLINIVMDNNNVNW